MKAIVVTCTIFAIVTIFLNGIAGDISHCQAPNGKGPAAVISQVLDLVPVDRILEALTSIIGSDGQIHKILEYLTSEKFKNSAKKIVKSPEFIAAVKNACRNLYVDVLHYINQIVNILGLPSLQVSPNRRRRDTSRDLINIVHRFIEVVPTEKIKNVLNSKIHSDGYVRRAVKALNSKETRTIVRNFFEQSEVKKVLHELLSLGVDVEGVLRELTRIGNELKLLF